jgi:hypothetical protein
MHMSRLRHSYVHGLVTGMANSQVVGTFARLGIADEMERLGATKADDLAAKLGADADALERFLRAAASLKLVAENEPGVFTLAAGECLRAGVPGTLRNFAVTFTSPGHWLPWGRLSDAVVTGRGQAVATLGAELFDYYRSHPDEDACFAAAMDEVTQPIVADVLEHLDWSGVSRVVDVGGSRGTLIAGVLAARAHLRGILFDRPEVVGGATRQLEASGVLDRCELVGGDFFRSVPPGGDVYLLKTVLHDWDDERSHLILTRCREAMDAESRLAVIELLLPPREPTRQQLLGDLTVLAVAGGRERTAERYAELCREAGLEVEEIVPLSASPGLGMVVARRSSV